jgi:WD40 repeat protein
MTALFTLQVEQLQLEKVIGLSPPSAYTVSHNPAKAGIIAYSAGSIVVVYDISTKQHIRYLQSASSGKLINCTAFSRDGKLVAGGEKGHAPCVLVWELDTGRCVAQLKGHKYGVSSVSFSADGGDRRGTHNYVARCILQVPSTAAVQVCSTQTNA